MIRSKKLRATTPKAAADDEYCLGLRMNLDRWRIKFVIYKKIIERKKGRLDLAHHVFFDFVEYHHVGLAQDLTWTKEYRLQRGSEE